MKLRIKEVAKIKGSSFIEIAKKTSIDKTTISRYNSGIVMPPLDKLQIIANALNCEIAELLPIGDRYGHFYVDDEWQGIRKK
ncbi:hypothetical protein CMU85_18195 [Elizabethkingia anophelis]|nr:hypothetical protein [Elizabethkingia anophelis]